MQSYESLTSGPQYYTAVLMGGASPRPRLYTYSAYTKQGGWRGGVDLYNNCYSGSFSSTQRNLTNLDFLSLLSFFPYLSLFFGTGAVCDFAHALNSKHAGVKNEFHPGLLLSTNVAVIKGSSQHLVVIMINVKNH